MAEFKSIKDKITTWDQRPWGNLEDLVKSKFSSGDDMNEELECTCGSTLLGSKKLLSPEKLTKSLSVKKKHNKRTSVTRTKSKKISSKIINKNFSSNQIINDSSASESSSASVRSIYPTLCDRPRIVEKSHRKKSKTKYPDESKGSIEIIKLVNKSRCSGVRVKKNSQKIHKSKLNTTNLLESPTSADYCDSNSSVDLKCKNKFKLPKTDLGCRKIDDNSSVRQLYRNKNKFKVKRTIEKVNDCDGTELDLNFEEPNSSRINKSRESFYRRSSIIENTRDSIENKEKISRNDNKIFTKLKTNIQNKIIDCCFESNSVCSLGCCCPEKYFKNNNNDKNSTESLCDCPSDSNGYNVKKKKLPSNWKKCDKYLKNISEEYRSLSSHLQEMQNEINNNNNKPDIELSYKFKSRKYSNADCSCQTSLINNKIESSENIDKSDDEDTVKALTSLCETLKTMSREMEPKELRVEEETCKTEYCSCNVGARAGAGTGAGAGAEDEDEDEEEEFVPIIRSTRLKKGRKKKQVRLHEFTFPKIVKPENSKGKADIRKMFVYAPEGGDQRNNAPLTLYRTCSFVNCNVKSNNDDGYKYHLTYVQKYVSPTWKPNQSCDQNDLYSSSDYG